MLGSHTCKIVEPTPDMKWQVKNFICFYFRKEKNEQAFNGVEYFGLVTILPT
jgi:hypothetical protein